jgi:outer membrane protein OmpA-like peptidoglycan-associated protein
VAPPSVGTIRKGDNVTVLFASESEHLPDAARSDLEKIAQKMAQDEGLTLQLLAYAAGDEANASKARRLSLTRALKVRTYLMEMGVRTGRIDVRGLGNKSEGGPADRVDLVLREH